jgi:hypothetical protein
LALIAKAFQRRRDVPLRCALHGNQGMGESQLTYFCEIDFFKLYRLDFCYDTTIEKMLQEFGRLLRFAHHPDQSNPNQSTRLEAARVRRWLEDVDTRNWLLIFDDVFPDTLDFLRQLATSQRAGNHSIHERWRML